MKSFTITEDKSLLHRKARLLPSPTFSQLKVKVAAVAAFCCLAVLAQGQITGTAFRDYNGDGIKQGGEPGREGIIVNFYGNAPLPSKDQFLGTTTTNTSGNYSYNPPSYPVRIEFVIPSGLCNMDPAEDFPAANGSTYGTGVQFATGPGVHNFIINYPADFAIDENPPVYVPCYINGDPLIPTPLSVSITGMPDMVPIQEDLAQVTRRMIYWQLPVR
jgi:hypothetical protein